MMVQPLTVLRKPVVSAEGSPPPEHWLEVSSPLSYPSQSFSPVERERDDTILDTNLY